MHITSGRIKSLCNPQNASLSMDLNFRSQLYPLRPQQWALTFFIPYYVESSLISLFRWFVAFSVGKTATKKMSPLCTRNSARFTTTCWITCQSSKTTHINEWNWAKLDVSGPGMACEYYIDISFIESTVSCRRYAAGGLNTPSSIGTKVRLRK